MKIVKDEIMDDKRVDDIILQLELNKTTTN